MPSKDQVKEEADFNSTRISETSRFVGFGLLAIYYAMMIDPAGAFASDSWWVTCVGLFGALAVALDYFQYVCGYAMARAALRDAEHRYHQGLAVIYFPLKWLAFVAKQLFALAGSVAVIVLILST